MGRRVLVVDDEDDIRELARLSLEHVGQHSVLVAGSGREALEVAARERPDAILLDVMMPDLDGLEVLERLHGDPRWQALPVVMLTAVSDTHTVRRCEQLGAKAFLVKAAFSVAEVLAQVHRYAPTGTGGGGDA